MHCYSILLRIYNNANNQLIKMKEEASRAD